MVTTEPNSLAQVSQTSIAGALLGAIRKGRYSRAQISEKRIHLDPSHDGSPISLCGGVHGQKSLRVQLNTFLALETHHGEPEID